MTSTTKCLITLFGAIFVLCALIGGANTRSAPATQAEFTRTTVDLGAVVSDVEKAVKFYTEAIGFTELEGFSVSGSLAADSGLSDGKPLNVRVLILGEGASATKLKLMQVPGTASKRSDNSFIHSQLGYSYLTVFVSDTDRALARLKRAGSAPLAKGPVALPADLAPGIYLTLVRDPDGNLIELVGPKGKE